MIVAAPRPLAQLINLVVLGQAVRLPPLAGVARVCSWRIVQCLTSPVLAAYLSAHKTMINGSALCAASAVTERD
jgi:hypothetical protein